jgi:dTDP-4-amino-4,6-dideoxygalactose transaminase
MPDRRHVYHIYAVRVARRDDVQQALHARGIQTGIHYPIPVHVQKAHADLGYGPGDFPHSERAAAEVLSLPMYAEISNAQIESVAAAVREGINVRRG